MSTDTVNNGILVANPFGKEIATSNSAALAEQQRAITEVQASLIIAQNYPRDQVHAVDEIIQACTRLTLAKSAIYSYQRGGTEITGPSIRLAEAIAQIWGHMQFGIREIAQVPGKSTVQAFAWDVQKNTRNVKEFDVPHIRYTKNGTKRLEDPRDIYEIVANQGARRVRSCILSLIPGDVIEAAIKQCENTLESKIDVTPDNIKKMLAAFSENFNVTSDMLEKRIGRHIDSINRPQMVQLQKIYNSLIDGMSTPSTWFEMPVDEKSEPVNIKKLVEKKMAERKAAADEKDNLTPG